MLEWFGVWMLEIGMFENADDLLISSGHKLLFPETVTPIFGIVNLDLFSYLL
jgi:hypothetical protein